MYAKSNSLVGSTFAFGLAACAIVAGTTLTAPRFHAVDLVLAPAPAAQTARYQPGVSEPSVQTRVARNDGLDGTVRSSVDIQRCPRCR